MFNCYDWQTNPVFEIARVSKMYEEQLEKVSKEEYIRDLLFADYVDKVKANMSRYDMFTNLFRDAQKQIDKKKKSERKELALLLDFVKEDFLSNDDRFELTSMISGGYECYYWDLYFKLNEQEFYITIPVTNNINVDNFKWAHNGMFCFYIKDSEYSSHCEKASYRIKDIADAIKEYFNLDADKHE